MNDGRRELALKHFILQEERHVAHVPGNDGNGLLSEFAKAVRMAGHGLCINHGRHNGPGFAADGHVEGCHRLEAAVALEKRKDVRAHDGEIELPVGLHVEAFALGDRPDDKDAVFGDRVELADGFLEEGLLLLEDARLHADHANISRQIGGPHRCLENCNDGKRCRKKDPDHPQAAAENVNYHDEEYFARKSIVSQLHLLRSAISHLAKERSSCTFHAEMKD